MFFKTLAVVAAVCVFLQVGLIWGQKKGESTREEQTGLALTVYNSNLGLVKDTRVIALAKGVQELKFMDVAEHIRPTTVHIRSVTQREGLAVLEQNYEYDLLSPEKLMEKYVGQEVHFVETDPESGEKTVTRAELLSTNHGHIFRVDGKILFEVPGRIELPRIPDNLIAKPTLAWLLTSKTEGKQTVEVSYLTGGIQWHADYVAVLNEKDTALDLSGWVTIDNRSGTTYENAALKLVAGDVQQVQPELMRQEFFSTRKVAGLRAADAPQFEEAAFFEYHMYTLGRKATIKNNQTKQMELLNSAAIAVQKRFVFQGDRMFFRRRFEGGREDKVGVYLEFVNAQKNNLGMPLPKGIVRVYKKDQDGGLQFVGEDDIDHTPKDENIKIKVGEAFDVVAERKQTNFEAIANRVTEVGFEIVLRNHKDDAITVDIREPVYGDWTVVKSSHEYTKIDAHEISFPVKVPPGDKASVTYRVRIRY